MVMVPFGIAQSIANQTGKSPTARPDAVPSSAAPVMGPPAPEPEPAKPADLTADQLEQVVKYWEERARISNLMTEQTRVAALAETEAFALAHPELFEGRRTAEDYNFSEAQSRRFGYAMDSLESRDIANPGRTQRELDAALVLVREREANPNPQQHDPLWLQTQKVAPPDMLNGIDFQEIILGFLELLGLREFFEPMIERIAPGYDHSDAFTELFSNMYTRVLEEVNDEGFTGGTERIKELVVEEVQKMIDDKKLVFDSPEDQAEFMRELERSVDLSHVSPDRYLDRATFVNRMHEVAERLGVRQGQPDPEPVAAVVDPDWDNAVGKDFYDELTSRMGTLGANLDGFMDRHMAKNDGDRYEDFFQSMESKLKDPAYAGDEGYARAVKETLQEFESQGRLFDMENTDIDQLVAAWMMGDDMPDTQAAARAYLTAMAPSMDNILPQAEPVEPAIDVVVTLDEQPEQQPEPEPPAAQVDPTIVSPEDPAFIGPLPLEAADPEPQNEPPAQTPVDPDFVGPLLPDQAYPEPVAEPEFVGPMPLAENPDFIGPLPEAEMPEPAAPDLQEPLETNEPDAEAVSVDLSTLHYQPVAMFTMSEMGDAFKGMCLTLVELGDNTLANSGELTLQEIAETLGVDTILISEMVDAENTIYAHCISDPDNPNGRTIHINSYDYANELEAYEESLRLQTQEEPGSSVLTTREDLALAAEPEAPAEDLLAIGTPDAAAEPEPAERDVPAAPDAEIDAEHEDLVLMNMREFPVAVVTDTTFTISLHDLRNSIENKAASLVDITDGTLKLNRTLSDVNLEPATQLTAALVALEDASGEPPTNAFVEFAAQDGTFFYMSIGDLPPGMHRDISDAAIDPNAPEQGPEATLSQVQSMDINKLRGAAADPNMTPGLSAA